VLIRCMTLEEDALLTVLFRMAKSVATLTVVSSTKLFKVDLEISPNLLDHHRPVKRIRIAIEIGNLDNILFLPIPPFVN